MAGHVARGPALRPGPGDPVLISQALARAADEQPSAGIGVDGDGGPARFTPYPDLLARARSVLAGLQQAGIAAGDTVLLQLARIDDLLTGLWGCLLGGIRPVVAAVPARLAATEPAGPARLAATEPAVAKLSDAWQRLRQPSVLADEAAQAGLAMLPDTHPLRQARVLRFSPEAAQTAPDIVAEPPGEPTDVALYMLSSGSTGRPKVIPLTHRGLVQLGIAGRMQMRVAAGDTALNWMPIDHSGALLLYHFVPLFAGAANWHVPTDWVLSEPIRWIDALDRHRATHSWAPTFGYRLVAEALRTSATQPGRYDLSRLTGLLCGGEQILYPVILDFISTTASFGTRLGVIQPAWGMTETCSGITFGWLDDPAALRRVDGREYVTVGTPSPGTQLRVVDPAGQPLPEGQSGRLHIRTQRLTPGYVDDPEANTAFVGDGWFDTGDLAQLHGDRLTIVGRAKELIILNGENHSCYEIEQVAGTAAGVRPDRVAAVGVPQAERGSEVLAIGFVPRPGADPAQAARAIAAVLSDRLGLTPALTVPLRPEEFPLTANGKVRRAELRERFTHRPPQPDSATVNPAPSPLPGVVASLREQILDTLATVLGQPVDPGRPFYEQGVDSVRLPQLASALQRRLDRRVTTLLLLETATVDALAGTLAAEPGAAAAAATPPPRVADRRVAIIGLAGRFPGADSVDEFWHNLCHGVDSVRRLRPEQLTAAGVPERVWKDPDYVPVSGLLGAGDPEHTIASFAADLFGISAREAATTDPQQRLFLECCHEALEQAGYAAGGGRVGVFAGSGMNLYSHRTYLREQLDAELTDPATALQAAMGNQPDFLATRVAYRLNLTGPALNIQTACSTGLVAVHQAILSLLAGDCDLALAGAAAIHVPQHIGYTYVDGSILSRSGQCRPFDAAADGTVGGNGVAVVVLKRLDHALADRDTIHAVILGSAVNNDGAGKVSFSAPSVPGQVAAITAALDAAGVSSDEIGLVEAHGTGTRLGDPIEVRALAEAFAARAGGGTDRCALGSVKANIGHLDSCAGMAGLVKSVAAVRSGYIPPQIHFDQLNPQIPLADSRFFIPVDQTSWPTGPRRLASVQALGVGGTNAHLVLEAPPPRPSPPDMPADRPALVLSAQTGAALDELAAAVAGRLRAPDPPAPADLLTTTALGRPHRRHRLVAWGATAADLAEVLTTGGRDVVRGDAAAAAPLAFAFSGQGQVLGGCAADLYGAHPPFREVVDRCAARFAQRYGTDLRSLLLQPAGTTPEPTDLAQPALFTYQVALAQTLEHYGVRPDIVAGHSVGEYAAWCVAAGLSIEDGLDLTAERGRRMSELASAGAMVAVRATRQTVEAVCAVVGGLELAVVNGTRDHVLAGEVAAVAEAVRLLRRREVELAELPVNRAFHSALLEPMLPGLREAAAAVPFAPTTLPVVSSMDGEVRPIGSVLDPVYVCEQTRRTARWDLALAALGRAGCRLYLEIGPGTVLSGMGRRGLPGSRWLATRNPGRSGLSHTLAELYSAGVPVDWAALATTGGRVPLPAHPLHRRTYWLGAARSDQG